MKFLTIAPMILLETHKYLIIASIVLIKTHKAFFNVFSMSDLDLIFAFTFQKYVASHFIISIEEIVNCTSSQ